MMLDWNAGRGGGFPVRAYAPISARAAANPRSSSVIEAAGLFLPFYIHFQADLRLPTKSTRIAKVSPANRASP
jgi:hypothetical protein